MKNKKTLTILIIVILVIGVVSGIFLINSSFDNNNQNNSNNNSNKPGDNSNDLIDNPTDTYEEVKVMAEGLYGGENRLVEVTEEASEFIITVKSTTNGHTMNKFKMDKKTGVISEEAIPVTVSVSD